MKNRAWQALFILLMICLGCSHVNDYLEIAQDGIVSKEYLKVLNTWTREDTAYCQFETRAHVIATYRSREFNEAYLAEYSKVYLLTENEKNLRSSIQRDLCPDFTEFLFYAYTPEKESNDFSRLNSTWSIYLVTENGTRISPLEVRNIRKITPELKEFFPYIEPSYGMVYSLKFSPVLFSNKELSDQSFKLIFTSVVGRVELEWQMNGKEVR